MSKEESIQYLIDLLEELGIISLINMPHNE